jgi:hypothetical protein
MKVCSICKGKPKPLTAFNKNEARKDGHQSHCRECGRKHAKRYYQSNKATMAPAIRKAKKARIKENYQRIYDYLLAHPCVDCKEDDPVVLDFDHVRGKKKGHVSRLASMGNSWETLEIEILKCDVRCANCHRRKSARQLGHFRASIKFVSEKSE